MRPTAESIRDRIHTFRRRSVSPPSRNDVLVEHCFYKIIVDASLVAKEHFFASSRLESSKSCIFLFG